MSATLSAYLVAARALGPLMPPLLRRRASRGKEDPARMAERLGRASAARSSRGPVVWFHAASVGESLSVLPLIEALREARPEAQVLITTGTATSAEVLAGRAPPGVLHQFVPVDGGAAPRRFIAHWRPDLAVWVESELWPALIAATAASGARLALVNARMSERSARGWASLPGFAKTLLERFDVVLAQDAEAAERLSSLGARDVRAVGSLKAGAAPPDRPEARAEMALALAGRPTWLAASTHDGEEAAVARAHRVASLPGLLTLVAPRHPERGEPAAQALRAAGLRTARRSLGEGPGPEVDALVLDTLGEMGAWYRLAPVAFVGGSLTPAGGHNPHEPAALDCAIVHGPQVANFAEDYAALARAEGALLVSGGEELGGAVATLLSDEPRRAALAAAAADALGDGRAALAETLEALTRLLPPPGRTEDMP